MNTLSYKTISVNKETAKKEWVVIDATDQVVGRLCSKVAKLIRGKYKPTLRRLTRSTPATLVILVVSVSTRPPSFASARTVSTRFCVMP